MICVKDQAVEAVNLIYATGYYVALFEHVLATSGVTKADILNKTLSDARVVLLMHDFWCELPDSKEIRRQPFFLICDIAENIFDIEADDA